MNEHPKRPSDRRTQMVGTAKRLVMREYVPLASWILSWFLIGLAVGHADAVRLLAANAVVQAVRHLCTVEAMQPLGRRMRTERAVFHAARRAALRIDAIALTACAVATALVTTLLAYRGMAQAAAMVAIAAASIPARNPGAILVARRDKLSTWRMGSALTFAVGAGLVLLFELNWVAAAAVLALRDWGGLVASLLFAPQRPMPRRARDEPLTFAEAATRTESSARRRLSYRLISSVAGLLLGPFGNLAARTSREVGRLDRRLAGWVPRKKSGFILFTLGTGGAALFFLLVSREPSAFLASAAFTRLAASGGTVLLWWRYGGGPEEDEDLDDE